MLYYLKQLDYTFFLPVLSNSNQTNLFCLNMHIYIIIRTTSHFQCYFISLQARDRVNDKFDINSKFRTTMEYYYIYHRKNTSCLAVPILFYLEALFCYIPPKHVDKNDEPAELKPHRKRYSQSVAMQNNNKTVNWDIYEEKSKVAHSEKLLVIREEVE